MNSCIKSLASKMLTLLLIPIFAFGLFAFPNFSNADGRPPQAEGVSTSIAVASVNMASIFNAFEVRSNTGRNTANGGDGDDGGDSGDSGDSTGSDEGRDTPRRDLQSPWGHGDNGDGDEGGDTGNTGAGGSGGSGGSGGEIYTGDAISTLTVNNDVNNNLTDIDVTNECDCELYNIRYMNADTYYKRTQEQDRDNDEHHDRHHNDNQSGDDTTVRSSHLSMYSKEYVPVRTDVAVENMNGAFISNMGAVDSNTGNNETNGGDGDDGGDSGDSGDSTGSNEGRDTPRRDLQSSWGHGDNNDGDEGGDTGTTGPGGSGGTGGTAGVIVTGLADTLVGIVNVTNRNVTRITR